MAIYKCCWNCLYSARCAANTKEEETALEATKRFCCAPFPVSNRLENPFKKRYCKQFVKGTTVLGHFITKEEAEKLNSMTEEEQKEYWAGEKMCWDGYGAEYIRDPSDR